MSKRFEEKGNALEAHFSFKDFREAQSFINSIADLSEQEQHHPEIHWVYNKIVLRLNTHDAGNTITEKDHKWVAAFEKSF